MSDLAHVRPASADPPGPQLPGGCRHTFRAGSRHAPPRRRGGASPGAPADGDPLRGAGPLGPLPAAGGAPALPPLGAGGGPARGPPPTETHFAARVRSVLYQQLAGAAAAAIHGRLIAALGGEVTPERLLALPDGTLRSVGLSGNKAVSLP